MFPLDHQYLARYTYYMLTTLATILTFAITTPSGSRPEEVTLAKLCVAEAGFNTDKDDCRAILRVLQNRPYKSITKAARMYNGRALGRLPPKTMRDAWVAKLARKESAPEGFPRGDLGWGKYLDKWKMRLLDARILLSIADNVTPCTYQGTPTEPLQWGGKLDKPDAGLVRLDCGDTLNRFYGRPVDDFQL